MHTTVPVLILSLLEYQHSFFFLKSLGQSKREFHSQFAQSQGIPVCQEDFLPRKGSFFQGNLFSFIFYKLPLPWQYAVNIYQPFSLICLRETERALQLYFLKAF